MINHSKIVVMGSSFLISLLAGCGTIPKDLGEIDRDRIVVVDGRGNLLEPVGNVGSTRYTSVRSMNQVVPHEDENAYINEVVDNIKDQLIEGNDVVVFIHGGLNTQFTTMERASQLFSLSERTLGVENPYFIAVNWQSSLVSSYRDNLFFIREGRDYRDAKLKHVMWGGFTSPLVFARDLGAGITAVPYALERNFSTYTSSLGNNHDRDILTRNLLATHYYNWHENVDRDALDQAMADTITWETSWHLASLVFPARIVTTALVRGFGQPSWDVMRRRTTLMFDRPVSPGNSDEDWSKGVLQKLGQAFTGIPDALKKMTFVEHQEPKLILICHSMGAIIGAKMLRMYPEMQFDDIVFMGAACAVQDIGEYVLPYLANSGNEKTRFFNLALHPKNELREDNALFLAPRGSLLVYLDRLLVHPDNLLERTAGRYENFAMALPYFEQEAERLASRFNGEKTDILSRVYLKTFPFAKGETLKYPRKHGDFAKFNFWQSSFYNPTQDCSPVRLWK